MAHQENQETMGNVHQALQPMVVELRDEERREHALSSLSYYLRQLVDNQEPEMYSLSSRFLFSRGTMGILKMEEARCITMLEALILSPRSCRRLMHILEIFKCMAASHMERPHFVINGYCDRLPRMIAFSNTRVPEDIREDIREGALSVVDILCQARDARVVWWILKNDVIDCINAGMRHGRESSKLLGTQILAVILEEHAAALYICSPYKTLLLYSLVGIWDQMTFLAFTRRIPSQVLLHIFLCYRRLCTIPKGLHTLQKENVSLNIMMADSQTIRCDYPQITNLLDEVLYFLHF